MSIEFQHVTKTYGKTKALDGISLTLEPGHIYGLLGNNGAGKSTLLNLLTDRQVADSGQILVDGQPAHNNDTALSKLFLVGEQNLFPSEIKVERAFRITAPFYPDFDMDYALALAQRFELPLKKRITALSTGYGSIFRLILGLSVNAPYVFFDEPVLGLDARHRELFYTALAEKYSTSGGTFLVSTHLIAEAENLIDHTIIIHQGRLLRDSPTEELLEQVFRVSGPAVLVDAYTNGKDVLSTQALGNVKTAVLQGRRPEDLPPELTAGRLGLQDYFISLQDAQHQSSPTPSVCSTMREKE